MARAYRDRDDDDPEESARRRKSIDSKGDEAATGESMAGIWIACIGVLVLIGGAIAFLLTRVVDDPLDPNKPVAQNPPLKVNLDNSKPEVKEDPPKVDTPNPVPHNPPVVIDPKQPEDPPKDPAKDPPKVVEDPPKKNPDPVEPPVKVNPALIDPLEKPATLPSLKADKPQQRLLRSTVWIVGERKAPEIPQPPVNTGGKEPNPAVNPMVDSGFRLPPDLQPMPGTPTPMPIPGQVVSKPGSEITGTGVLVDRKHRLLITTGHVAGNAATLKVFFPEADSQGKPLVARELYKAKPGLSARVVGHEPRADLVLLQLEKMPDHVQPLPLAKVRIMPGQPVHALGNPNPANAGPTTGLWAYSASKVRQLAPDKWKVYDDDEGRFVSYEAVKGETDTPLAMLDSGSPVLNDRGSLVGVGHSGNFSPLGRSVFIDGGEVRLLLEKFYQALGEPFVPEPEMGVETQGAQIADLIKKLRDPDFSVRVQAVKVLGSLGPDANLAFATLFAALREDRETVVRRVISDEIEKIPPHKDDVGLLVEACKDSSAPLEIRIHAVKALARLGPAGRNALPDLVSLAKAPDEDLKRAALTSLAILVPEVKDVPELAKILKTGSAECRRLVLAIFLRMGPEATKAAPEIWTLVKNSDKVNRVHGLRTLETFGPPTKEGLGTLNELLKDTDRDVALQAARMLVKAGDSKAAVPFLTATLKAGSTTQRQMTVHTLGEIGPEAKVVAREIALTLEDDQVRPLAVEALARIGKASSPIVSGRLNTLLKTPNSSGKARLACIECLSQVGQGSKEALMALFNAYRMDPWAENRYAAAQIGQRFTAKN